MICKAYVQKNNGNYTVKIGGLMNEVWQILPAT